jgi:hypothetical protein
MRWRLDSRIGGLGDVWMRLVALYALAKLVPAIRVEITVPSVLAPLGAEVFGARLDFTPEPAADALVYTHLGLAGIWRDLLHGRRFVLPFVHTQVRDRPRPRWQDRVNLPLLSILAATGVVRVPPAHKNEAYHGLTHVAFVPEFDAVPAGAFAAQCTADLPELRARLAGRFPARPEFPLLVFPGGTCHQFMPADWAVRHLSAARLAFHGADDSRAPYEALGFRTESYATPEELLALAARARRIVATDSFPSHLLQTYSSSTVLALTQHPARRVVNPAFDGRVVESRAPCCPCRNIGRDRPCAAGHATCLTWGDEGYTRELVAAARV